MMIGMNFMLMIMRLKMMIILNMMTMIRMMMMMMIPMIMYVLDELGLGLKLFTIDDNATNRYAYCIIVQSVTMHSCSDTRTDR